MHLMPCTCFNMQVTVRQTFPVLLMAYDTAAQPGACEHARAVTLFDMFECISSHNTGDTLSSVVS